MIRRGPKQNIPRKFSDIRAPGGDDLRAPLLPPPPPPLRAELPALARRASAPLPLRSSRSRGLLRKALSVSAVALLLSGLFLFSEFRDLQGKLAASAMIGFGQFQAAVSDLKLFNLPSAQEKAAEGGARLEEMSRGFAPYEAFLAGGFGQNFLPFLKEAGMAYKDFQALSAAALSIVESLEKLQASWPRAFFAKDGSEFVASLERIQQAIGSIADSSNRLANQGKRYGDALPLDAGSYLSMQIDLGRAKAFLDSFVPWVKSPEERRIAVLLGNPSELRPGGGFTGSYAEIILKDGAVQDIEVRDIAYADRAFEPKIVPPQPLQLLVKRWRAADANWFFDFSLSAKKTLEFLELSETYRKDGISFDAAIGVSARAVEDLLALAGPIELASGRRITEDNLLPALQAEVQAGHDVGSLSAKRILGELAPVLMEKLAALPADRHPEILSLLGKWAERKDLMVYFKDPVLERFFEEYGATGSLAKLAPDWQGDYLAVVNANIGGGKTDIYMKQKVVLQSQISEDGALNNHLTVRRTHAAPADADWWHAMRNQNYLQVFTPPGAQLDYASGGLSKGARGAVDYEGEGFSVDPDLASRESSKIEHLGYPAVTSFLESGRNVFATWTQTERGGTSELSFDYSRRLPRLPSDGEVYEFVFEKQAASEGEYVFEFTAPVGYRFKENGLPAFEFKTDDPPGRLVLRLTLEKI